MPLNLGLFAITLAVSIAAYASDSQREQDLELSPQALTSSSAAAAIESKICGQTIRSHNALAEQVEKRVEPWVEKMKVSGLYPLYAFAISRTEKQLAREYASLYEQAAPAARQAPTLAGEQSPIRARLETLRAELQKSLSEKLKAQDSAFRTHGDRQPHYSSSVVIRHGEVNVVRCAESANPQEQIKACVSMNLANRTIKGSTPLEALNHPATTLGQTAGKRREQIYKGYNLNAAYEALSLACSDQEAISTVKAFHPLASYSAFELQTAQDLDPASPDELLPSGRI